MTLRTINLGTVTGKVANRIERRKVDILVSARDQVKGMQGREYIEVGVVMKDELLH